MKIVKHSTFIILLGCGPCFADSDVKLYDRAPSLEELQQQLKGKESGASKKTFRTRAIVFGDAAPDNTADEAAADAAKAADGAADSSATATAVLAEDAPNNRCMNIGGSAIAFPINFSVNSSDISPESVPFIASIADLLQKNPSMRLVIEGHTDSSGSAQLNMALSRERAFSVMNYLIDHYQISPMRLVPVGRGFSEPLGGMEPTNPRNRRVQFRSIG